LTQDTEKQNVCCGSGVVDWQNFYGTGAYMDIDTNSCKFSGDDVMYFTEIFGQGGQWTKNGAQAIYTSTKSGFRVYINEIKKYSSSPAKAWEMNSLQHRIKWCGVGASTGSRSQAVCCGVGKPSDLSDYGGALYTDVSTRACKFGSEPIYLTSVTGKTVAGRSVNWDLNGAGASYPGIGVNKNWFRMWLGGIRNGNWLFVFHFVCFAMLAGIN